MTMGATTLSRMNFSAHICRTCDDIQLNVHYCALFSSMVRVLGLGLGLGLDLVSGWLVVMHTYVYYVRLSLSHCPEFAPVLPPWKMSNKTSFRFLAVCREAILTVFLRFF